jgi:hypothetical protein
MYRVVIHYVTAYDISNRRSERNEPHILCPIQVSESHTLFEITLGRLDPFVFKSLRRSTQVACSCRSAVALAKYSVELCGN